KGMRMVSGADHARLEPVGGYSEDEAWGAHEEAGVDVEAFAVGVEVRRGDVAGGGAGGEGGGGMAVDETGGLELGEEAVEALKAGGRGAAEGAALGELVEEHVPGGVAVGVEDFFGGAVDGVDVVAVVEVEDGVGVGEEEVADLGEHGEVGDPAD